MKHRRKTLLIDRYFQIRFSLFVTSWVLVLTLVFPSILYSSIDAFLRILSRKVDIHTLQGIQNFQAEIVSAIIFFMVVVAVLIFLISLYVSHRVAGPVYKIRNALEGWKEGQVATHLTLRKADYFSELAEAYNEAADQHTRTQDGIQKSCDQLSKLSQSLEPQHQAQVKEIVSNLLCFSKKS